MASDLSSVLGWATITSLVRQQADGIPKVLPPAFYTTTRAVKGKVATYTRIPGTRNLGRFTEYGAPSLRLDQKGISTVPVVLLHEFNHITMDPTVLINLRQMESYAPQNMGEEEIGRQTMSVAQRFQNTRTASIHSLLANGTIWYDSSGNLLPSSSGAMVTADFGVAASHKSQLNAEGTGNIISTSWDNPTANIPGQLRALQDAAARITGFPIKYAVYGRNVPEYLSANDYIAEFWYRAERQRTEYLEGNTLPREMLDITWVPGHRAFYEDSAGTNQQFFGADTVTFFPEVDRNWYEVFEGSYPVPTSLNIAGEGLAAAENLKEVVGMGGYGRIIDDPVTIKVNYFDTFLPLIKLPDAVFIATVKF